MYQALLKSLFGKRSEFAGWLGTWCHTHRIAVAITDAKGNGLFRSEGAGELPFAFGLQTEAEDFGTLMSSDARAQELTGLIQMMLQKESEKRKLGSEVLHLYQELNVIYNFSESLAQAIEPDAIAALTLAQAMQSIPSDSGVVMLWDSEQLALKIPSLQGEALFSQEKLVKNVSALLRIGLNGQSQIIDDLTLLKEKEIIGETVQSLVYATLKGKHRVQGAIILAGRQAEQFTAAHLKLLVTLALQSSSAIESANLFEKHIREVKMREEAILRINESIKKFVPNEFISSLGKENITDVKLGDLVEKEVTILFTDIRDFTTLSEKMSPEENFRFVSSFNERLGPVIRANHGFINQYLGDSIMAIFPREPLDALKASVAMHEGIRQLNGERALHGLPAIRAGIGMHTGPLIMGITGDEHRLDAATISDTVNTAARIEGLTKYYNASILLSAETVQLLNDQPGYHFRPLGRVLLKGKHNYLEILECLNGMEDDMVRQRSITLSRFRVAVQHYQGGNFDTAIELWKGILAEDPGDRASFLFLEKAMARSGSAIPENWTGVEEIHFK